MKCYDILSVPEPGAGQAREVYQARHGAVCDTKCPPGTFGLDCADQCSCHNDGEVTLYLLTYPINLFEYFSMTTYQGRVSAVRVRAGRELCVTGPVLQAVMDTTAPSLTIHWPRRTF